MRPTPRGARNFEVLYCPRTFKMKMIAAKNRLPALAYPAQIGGLFSKFLIFVGFLSTFSAPLQASAESAGEVMFVAGAASQHTRSGGSRSVVKGLKLAQGDTIRTDTLAYVYVRMADTGLLVVRPQSELHIDRWVFDPSRPEQSEIKYTLLSGVARYVSGHGSEAAKDKFRFNTPLAAIGVRGTDFTVLARADLTQVSVRSGAVVVGSLGSGCTAEGLGPCSGENAMELLASQREKVLQVSAGTRQPSVVDSSAAGSPDKVQPPSAGEPLADSGSKPFTGTIVTGADREAAVGSLTTNRDPVPTIAAWGRWGALLDADAGAAVVQQVLKGRKLVAINRHYVLGANQNLTPEMPNTGVGKFKIAAHEGLLVDPGTGTLHETTASSGILQIDFGTRRFQTSIDLESAAASTSIQSTGFIESNGRMASDPFVSSTSIDGLIGGSGTSEAAYLYRRSSHQGIEVSGAVLWKK